MDEPTPLPPTPLPPTPLQQLLSRIEEATPDSANKSAARELALTALLDLATGPVYEKTLVAPKSVLRQELKPNGGSAERLGVSSYQRKGIEEFSTASQNQSMRINTAFNKDEAFRTAVLKKLQEDLTGLGMPQEKANELVLDTEHLRVGTSQRQSLLKPIPSARRS